MSNQITFDAITKPKFKINKPIRLIELFAGQKINISPEQLQFDEVKL